MICYHNLGEIAHDVVTACLVRIGIKKRARCCDYWDLYLNKSRDKMERGYESYLFATK